MTARMGQIVENKATETESRILEAAEHEFMLKGFAAARTTAIAEAAGVTHAMLHYYFRTKEKLFGTVVADKLTTLARMFALKFDNDSPLDECLRQAVEVHFDFVCANPELPRFMVSEVFSNPVLLEQMQGRIEKIAGPVIATLQRKIDEGVTRGECRPMQARSIMFDIVSLNVFPVLAMPLMSRMMAPATPAQLLEMRRQENVETILQKIKIQ